MCIGAVLGLAGGIISGIGAAQAANAQAASYAMQAKAQERQANLLREQGSYEGARFTEQGRQLIGRQVAGFAENGVALNGSAGEVVRSTGQNLALDLSAKRYGQNIAIENELMGAKMNRYNAASAKSAAPMAFLSPVISGATRIAGSFS
jgi:hypothetical protein